uniref:Uncharacterized protein n=1 Tax=Oryza brachyantha TaxID=4533 RepID=J3NDP2_ORYBR
MILQKAMRQLSCQYLSSQKHNTLTISLFCRCIEFSSLPATKCQVGLKVTACFTCSVIEKCAFPLISAPDR